MQVGSEANTIPESDGVSAQTPDLTVSFALQHTERPWEADDMGGGGVGSAANEREHSRGRATRAQSPPLQSPNMSPFFP